MSLDDTASVWPFLVGVLLVGVGLLLRIEAAILSLKAPSTGPDPRGHPPATDA
jgi:hypothetical protein